MLKLFTGIGGILTIVTSVAVSACANNKNENKNSKYAKYLKALETGDGSKLSLDELVEGHKWVMSQSSDDKIKKLKEIFPNGIEKISYTANKNDSHFNSVFDFTGSHTPLFKIGTSATGAYLIEQEKNEIILSGVNFTTDGDIGLIKNSKIYFDMLNYLVRNNKKETYKIGVIGNANQVNTYLSNNSFSANTTSLNLNGLSDELKKEEIDKYDLIVANEYSDHIDFVADYNKPLMMHFPSQWWVEKTWNYIFDKFQIFLTSNGGTFRADSLVGEHPVNIKEDINLDNTYEGVASIGSKEIDSLLELLYNDDLKVTAQSGAFDNTVKDGNPKHDWNKITLDNDGRTVQKAAYAGLKQVESIVKGFDKINCDVFDTNLNYYKGILLQADYYRSLVEYSKDTDYKLDLWDYDNSTSTLSLRKDIAPVFKAIFADSSVLYSRKSNLAQPDLGDFSPNEDNVRKMTTKDYSLKVKAGRDPHNVGSSTGIYIKAGETASITLKTNTADNVSVIISSLRDGTIRPEWPTRYKRPYSIRGNFISLKYNKEIKISSPHGGPLYLLSNSSDISTYDIQFKNTLKHPTLLNHKNQQDVLSFLEDIQSNPINWIDIKSDYAELHMNRETIIESLKFRLYNGNVEKFVEHYNKYTTGGNFEYAGYTGDGLNDLSDDVKNWGRNIGLYDQMYDQSIHGKRWTQHYNIERPTCGDLCSGNPADQWAPHFRPTSWGENHEVGHNLQAGRLKVYDGKSGEVSNNIFPVNADYKLQLNEPALNYISPKNGKKMYFERTNYTELFDLLNESHNNNESPSTNHTLWAGDANYFTRLGAYHQMRQVSQTHDFYTIAYIYHRFIDYYTENDSRFTNEIRDKLKISSYSREDARENIKGGDLFAIVASNVSGNDVTDFIEGLGIKVSDKAKNQIASEGYASKIPKGLFYVYQEEGKYQHYIQNENGEFNGDITLSDMEMPTYSDIITFGNGKKYTKN